jgi:hypothetical protein
MLISPRLGFSHLDSSPPAQRLREFYHSVICSATGFCALCRPARSTGQPLISLYCSGMIHLKYRLFLYRKRNGEIAMIKTHQIYKKDKWNMLTVEVNGKTLIVREISDQWGEESHTFMARPALMHWAEERFRKEDYAGNEEEWEEIMKALREV